MKKIMRTLPLEIFVALTTALFCWAEYVATHTAGNFPYFQLGCLIVGGLIIISLKQKYERFHLSEAIASFALYTVLVVLFTPPIIDVLKSLVG